MMAIIDLAHTALACADMNASLRFYEKLGIRESFRLMNDDGSLMLIYLHIAGDRFLELFPHGPAESDRAGQNRQSFRHICLMVDDIETTVEDLRAANVTIDVEPKMGLDSNMQAWIRDPDGNQIELMQISEESPQRAIAAGTAFPASETLILAE